MKKLPGASLKYETKKRTVNRHIGESILRCYKTILMCKINS